MPDLSVTTLDIAILLIYVLGTRLFFGWWIKKKRKDETSENYFLAGRKLTWPIIGLSFYVSNMSGSTFIGLPGSGYNDGIAVYNYEWIPVVILILFIIFILPFYLRSGVFTSSGYLEKRFDHRSKLAFSGFLLTANIFIDAAAALFAGGMVMKVLFPEIPLWQTLAVISLIAGVYIYFGGLDAVVINDVLQAIMIFIGGAVILYLTYENLPSWEALTKDLPEKFLHLKRSPDDSVMPWPGMISGVFIVGLYFWCTNQFVIQRALGAKTLEHGRWGALFAGLLKLPNLFILILPGVMALHIFPDLERPDMVFPALAFHVLPVGVRGLILAALAAAILSSLEAIFNSASTLFTMDFVKHFKPDVKDKTLVASGKIMTLVFMALSAVWATQIDKFPTLWQYLQSVLSYVTPPVVVVFLAGIFWKRSTADAAFYTLTGGIILGTAGWVTGEIFNLFTIQYLYASGVMFLFSTALIIGFSMVTKARSLREIDDITWRRELWQKEKADLDKLPLHKNYRVLSLVLLVLTAVIVIIWW